MFGCSRGAGAAAVLSSLELEAPSLELSELVLQSCGRLSIGQSVDEPIDLPADALPFAADARVRPGFRLQAIPFGGEFLREDLEQVRIHQPAAQAVHHRRLERVPADGQTIAADVSPLLRAVEQPKCASLILEKPPPQTPQRIRPEKR